MIRIENGKIVKYHKVSCYGVDSLFMFSVAEFLEDKPNIKNIVLGNKIRFIEEGAFNECVNLERIIFPKEVIRIEKKAFATCPNLKQIEIIDEDTDIFPDTFVDSTLKYFYKLKNNKRLLASKDYPQEECEYVLDMQSLYDAYAHYNVNILRKQSTAYKEAISDFAKKLNKYDMIWNISFVETLLKNSMTTALEFLNESDLRFFSNEISLKLYNETYHEEEYTNPNFKITFDYGFLKFVKALGCFENYRWQDKFGKDSEYYRSQKSCSLLAKFLKSGAITYRNAEHIFRLLPVDFVCCQDFVNFISVKDEKGDFANLKMLINLEENYSGIFSEIMQNFEIVKSFRTIITNDGKVKNISWKDAIEKFYAFQMYGDWADENPEYALLFASKNIDANCAKRAKHLIEHAKLKDIPNHILNKPINEMTIKEQIETLISKQNNLLKDSKVLVNSVYDKMFTYEMLEKHNPINAVIGAFCSCCAVIDRVEYGSDIAKNSIINPDIQNMVVRDKNGDIVAKGALYVNREHGYAVFNDFELNYIYKKDEKIEPGVYRSSPDSIHSIQREKIFETFMRGTYAFVYEYNKQNPDNPLKKVLVGLGYNRLREYCERYPKNNCLLEVPEFFQDASREQIVLFDSDNSCDMMFYEKWIRETKQNEISSVKEESLWN